MLLVASAGSTAGTALADPPTGAEWIPIATTQAPGTGYHLENAEDYAASLRFAGFTNVHIHTSTAGAGDCINGPADCGTPSSTGGIPCETTDVFVGDAPNSWATAWDDAIYVYEDGAAVWHPTNPPPEDLTAAGFYELSTIFIHDDSPSGGSGHTEAYASLDVPIHIWANGYDSPVGGCAGPPDVEPILDPTHNTDFVKLLMRAPGITPASVLQAEANASPVVERTLLEAREKASGCSIQYFCTSGGTGLHDAIHLVTQACQALGARCPDVISRSLFTVQVVRQGVDVWYAQIANTGGLFGGPVTQPAGQWVDWTNSHWSCPAGQIYPAAYPAFGKDDSGDRVVCYFKVAVDCNGDPYCAPGDYGDAWGQVYDTTAYAPDPITLNNAVLVDPNFGQDSGYCASGWLHAVPFTCQTAFERAIDVGNAMTAAADTPGAELNTTRHPAGAGDTVNFGREYACVYAQALVYARPCVAAVITEQSAVSNLSVSYTRAPSSADATITETPNISSVNPSLAVPTIQADPETSCFVDQALDPNWSSSSCSPTTEQPANPSSCGGPDIPAIDLTPLNFHDAGNRFPFGVFGWIRDGIAGFAGAASAPVFHLHLTSFGGHDMTIDLAPFDPYMPTIRATVLVVSTVLSVWFLATALLGVGGGKGDE